MKNDIKIVECTFRDGSYAVNFSFTLDFIAKTIPLIEKLGFEFIELGHGYGLGASSEKWGIAKYSDIEYIKEAIKVANPKTNIGAFFIPYIGNNQLIKEGKENGLKYLKIGIDIPVYNDALDSIKFAHNTGLKIFFNLMKSYAVSIKEFEKILDEIKTWPIDGLFLVDSAGCMIPEQVANMISIMKNKVPFEIGFHGHNNLNLAEANSLIAINNGADYIDSTFNGIGRSAGNAQTEIVIALLQKKGLMKKFNEMDILNFNEKYIAPLVNRKYGNTKDEIMCGIMSFHSRFLKTIEKYAEMYNVNKDLLLIAIAKDNVVNPSENEIEKMAKLMKNGDKK